MSETVSLENSNCLFFSEVGYHSRSVVLIQAMHLVKYVFYCFNLLIKMILCMGQYSF